MLILHTGGTIGMMPTEKGYAPVKGYFEKALEDIRDLKFPEMPQWDFMEMDVLLDSSNMTVEEWNEIGEIIYDKYREYDGFVVLHGTDTMAYTASALSFMPVSYTHLDVYKRQVPRRPYPCRGWRARRCGRAPTIKRAA